MTPDNTVLSETLDRERSVTLSFSKKVSPEVDTHSVSKWLSIEPPVEKLEATIEGEDITLRGGFSLNERYTVRVKPGLPAAEPFALPQTVAREFSFEPLPARIYFPAFSTEQLSSGKREFQFRTINAGDVRVRAKLLTRDTLVYALEGYKSYNKKSNEPKQDVEPYREVDFAAIPGKTIYDRSFHSPNTLDELNLRTLEWDKVLAGRKTGAVFLAAEKEAESPNERATLGSQSLVQVTDIGLAWKQDHSDDALIYAFSQSTGKPMPHASLRVLSAENDTLAEAVCDENGLGRVHAADKAKWLIAESGEDIHAVEFRPIRTNESGGPWHDRFLPMWHFHIPMDWYAGGESRREVMIFADRPVYQPGETLHLEVIARERNDADMSVAGGLKGHVEFNNARGEAFLKKEFTLSRLGSYSEAILMPDTLGSCHATLWLDDHPNRRYWFNWQVEQYKPNTFEIKLDAKPSYPAGETPAIGVAARYLFGKSLAKAKVHWSLRTESSPFSDPALDDFDFSCSTADSSPRSGAQQGQTSLDENGRANLSPKITPDPRAPQPVHANLLVEITDLNQQTISERTEFTQQSSDFYLGIKTFSDVLTAGHKVPVALVAFSADGTPHGGTVQASARLKKIKWNVVRQEGAGGALTYKSEEELTQIAQIQTHTLQVHKTGEHWETEPADNPGFDLAEPGDYIIEADATDSAGRLVRASERFSVADPKTKKDRTTWPYPNEAQIDLMPDKQAYSPGETATILIKTPISGKALVTVERDTVSRSFLTDLAGNAPSIQIPLAVADAPNVFVSVVPGARLGRKRPQNQDD